MADHHHHIAEPAVAPSTWAEVHQNILVKLKSEMEGERDWVANCANASSIIYRAFVQMQPNKANWVGFYIIKGEDLVLGPFHGSKAEC